ncbi:MAG TPA: lysophospholipid acyltransferase family protein, partial [Anaeromyxobacteraceae bacterium]|nr:lysophospholipid acyltransferase family protein [Anaeromyxobacteraceae bacterium]
ADAPAEPTPTPAVPAALAAFGRRLLGAGQKALYEVLYGARVTGRAFVPHDRNVLVVANHASHLDMGLVKVALAEEGERLAALAARDYFFDTPLKRAYFENFTNLIPMERHGSLGKSLRAGLTALGRGYHLLIFPEGTRSRDGAMGPFYPAAGHLALHAKVDVLPVWLGGTHEALPVGSAVPRRATLEVRIGEPIRIADLEALTAGLSRREASRRATALMEEAVRRLGGEDASPRADQRPRSPSLSPDVPAASRPLTPALSPGGGEGEGKP